MKRKRLFVCISMLLMTAVGCHQQQQALNLALTPATPLSAHKQQRLANVEQNVESLLAQMTLDEKISLTHANAKFSIAAIERLGIHEMWMSDGPHGVRHEIERYSWNSANWQDDQSTYLPPLTAVAASWNREMAALHGNVLGSEARQRNKDVILGPGVNLARLPLYGRNFEYLGEDPFLAAKLVVPAVKAIQSNDVAASVKHYALNTQELNRIGVDAKPDERTLREVYLPAFEAAVKQGNTHTIMGAYNRYYGTNANQSKHLVMDILKGEWGYKGVLLTDWNVDINTYDAAMNGLDIEMGTAVDSFDDYFLAQPLKLMIESGKVPMAVLDDKVRRILRVQLSIGMMDKHRLSGQRNTTEHHQAARKIISEGIVLLKNEQKVLPLEASKLKNVLVLGPNAEVLHSQGGGSSEVKPLYEISPLQGLQNKLGADVNITVMRAQNSAGVAPIATDYMATRHWTGTPQWELIRYKDDGFANIERQDDWIANSSYKSSNASAPEFVRMSTDIKPLESGEHILKLALKGQASLRINGKQVMSEQVGKEQVFEQAIELDNNQTYQFELQYAGMGHVTLGWDAPGALFTPEAEYLAAAKDADAVIYFGGLSHADDREAIDRIDMKLPNGQDAVISKLLQANPNTVVFLNGGSAVEMPWVDEAQAIVWGWYGGMEAGNAYADVLFGDVNPSGKMPITLPRTLQDTAPIKLDDYNAVESLYKEGVFIGYRWFEQQKITPLFPFGHGLSYTQFQYSDIKLSANRLKGDESLIVTAKITNTGDSAGSEVVQLYLQDIESSVPRPAKELKGFSKIHLQPGETGMVTMTLNQRDLSFWDVNSADWLAEPGEFKVMIGASVADIRLDKQFNYRN
ncbi:glycoside hydrolase family 3 C-terminal domain-containing protein [Shewanella woodyi]|uniref:Beta-D-glucoside glucohydrolase n=1 Tax=Shewanella woodyi (strain ATCC 51908 / MS32) TaxID=392500 RepID=B1KLN2_SHEWM|nr:glycoside hydrolase family 3 C-terminal domain-containing protein [Shewanella woodyi]ACA87329.1 Beta-glucosidase [Shewanella woodyi ATCC 51908]